MDLIAGVEPSMVLKSRGPSHWATTCFHHWGKSSSVVESGSKIRRS